VAKNVHRRLAAILAADVVGYSRLMGEDEAGTLDALRAHREAVIEPKVAEHDGRIVKLMGDGLLAEFPSAVEAVQCAVEIQRASSERNVDVLEERRMTYRIGINIGDIIVEGEDIYGDGVNVAARMEGLAEPGGICVARNVFDQVKGKVELDFEDMGEQQVKNISEPIRVYRVVSDALAVQTVRSPSTVLPLPDKPSIAVLPFVNMSGDPEQEYFADGIAEDIITALSRFHWFFVISRNSSFSYKGKSVEAKKVARELGVRYILEGSVRRAGNRVRINAQLIDATEDHHVWAERYDRELDDIFAVQDDITESIVASVAPEFLSAEVRRTLERTSTDLNAWERVMQARWHVNHYTRDGNQTGRSLLLEAVATDPKMAQAYSELAVTHVLDILYGWSEDADGSRAAAQEAAKRAIALDNGDALAYAASGLALTWARKFDGAIDAINKAVALNPNLALAHGYLGVTLGLAGDYEASIAAVNRALRLSPRDYGKALWYAGWGIGAFIAGRHEEVIELTGSILREYPGFATAYRQRAASMAALGRLDEARENIEALLGLLPGLTVSRVTNMVPIKDPEAQKIWLDSLRKAGLPE
jgi:adenylate cyclase